MASSPPPFNLADPAVRELRDILARIYFDKKSIVDVLVSAGLGPGDYDLEGRAHLVWGEILGTAYNRAENAQLLDEIQRDPKAKRWHARIAELLGPSRAVEAEGGEPESVADDEELERVMGEKSTLLDIAFLERGIRLAPAVVRLTAVFDRQPLHGTGFLVREQRLLTNHHVLFDSRGQPAVEVTAWFDHELDAEGKPRTVEERRCDVQTIDGEKPHDWAIVELAEGLVKPRPEVALVPPRRPLEVGDRVYIVQHPYGGYKQIGLHHNVVTHVGDTFIQYLTDTDHGSSGSPVFNDRWELVALHHRHKRLGGEQAQAGERFGLDDRGSPGVTWVAAMEYRNQGVRIERVIEGLAKTRKGG